MNDQIAPDGWALTGDAVEHLDKYALGCWLTTTRGSRHVWETEPDGVHWARMPGDGRAQFDGDAERQLLTSIERWPAVGDKFLIWFDSWLTDEWRLSSTIRSIERLERAPLGSGGPGREGPPPRVVRVVSHEHASDVVLCPSCRGRWIVESQSGTTCLLDLDEATATR